MASKKFRKNSVRKMKKMRLLAVLAVPAVALILWALTPQVWAGGKSCGRQVKSCKKSCGQQVKACKKSYGRQVCSRKPTCVIELDEAEVFIEFNSTDDDRGIQFFWDGEPWKWMRVKNGCRQAVLDVIAQRNVSAQGLTEGFFESAEPTSEELTADEFLARFPEGDYKFWGKTLDGCRLVGEAELTHDLPIPVELDIDFPSIEWTQPEGGPDVVGYEVVVELVVLEDGDERVFVDTATFPGTVYEFEVSPQFQDLIEEAEDAETIEELKVEVIATEASGNKTITEEEVELEEDEEDDEDEEEEEEE